MNYTICSYVNIITRCLFDYQSASTNALHYGSIKFEVGAFATYSRYSSVSFEPRIGLTFIYIVLNEIFWRSPIPIFILIVSAIMSGVIVLSSEKRNYFLISPIIGNFNWAYWLNSDSKICLLLKNSKLWSVSLWAMSKFKVSRFR